MACACCGGCELDADCPPKCGEGEHVVYDASSQPYCCPEDRNYIGNSGGDCLLVPEGTVGDEDKIPASDGIPQCCCNNTCADCPCPESFAMPLALPAGPGTELKALLSWFGFKALPGCVCNKRARYMDKMGCDWCEQNLGQITGWLQEEHARQKSIIPFVPMAVEQVVRLAIRRARKKGNSQ